MDSGKRLQRRLGDGTNKAGNVFPQVSAVPIAKPIRRAGLHPGTAEHREHLQHPGTAPAQKPPPAPASYTPQMPPHFGPVHPSAGGWGPSSLHRGNTEEKHRPAAGRR